MTTITLLDETTEPAEYVHFHPAFPMVPDRSSLVADLPFDCLDRKFETVLHCLQFARFSSLDQEYAELFTLPQAQAFNAACERIQLGLFCVVTKLSGMEKLKFMGQATSFFHFKNAIATSRAIAHVAECELNFFRTEAQQVVRKALFARYAKFAGTLPEPVVFESRAYPRMAVTLGEVLAQKPIPRNVTSAQEVSAYKLHALLSIKPQPAQPLQTRAPAPVVKTIFERLAENDPWELMWSLSHRPKAKERVQQLFLFAFPKFKASLLLVAFGPTWMQSKKSAPKAKKAS